MQKKKKRPVPIISPGTRKLLAAIGLVVVLLGGTGGAGYVLLANKEEPFQPARFLPPEVLVCWRQYQLAETAGEFFRSPLGTILGSTNYARLALDLEVPLEEVEQIRDLQHFLQSEIGRAIFAELMGEDFTVAILPDPEAENLQELLRNNILMFARPRHDLASLRQMSERYLGGDTSYSIANYGRYQIHRIAYGAWTISFTHVGPQIIAALEERKLRRALDRYDNAEANLLGNTVYRQLTDSAASGFSSGYISLELVRRQLLPAGEGQGSSPKWLERLRGFTALTLVSREDQFYDSHVATLHFRRDLLNAEASAFLRFPPEVNGGIAMVPPEAPLYYWTNTLDLKEMWRVYTDQSDLDAAAVNSLEQKTAALTGVPFAQLLGLADHSIHIILSKPSAVDFVPFPNVTLALPLTDEKQAATVFETLLSNSRIPHVKATYRDIAYTFWGVRRQRGLQPLYAIHNNTLFLSSSVRTYRRVVDAMLSGDSLQGQERYENSEEAFTKPSNSTIFIHFPQFIESTEELVQWAGEMLAIQNRSTAYKARKAINDFILPVLRALNSYESAAARTHVGNDAMVIETHLVKTKEDT